MEWVLACSMMRSTASFVLKSIAATNAAILPPLVPATRDSFVKMLFFLNDSITPIIRCKKTWKGFQSFYKKVRDLHKYYIPKWNGVNQPHPEKAKEYGAGGDVWIYLFDVLPTVIPVQ